MSKRRDIMTPRQKKDGGTYWVKIGTAWDNDNGGTQLVFDALPIADKEGRVVANLFEPREKSAAVSEPAAGYPNYSNRTQRDPVGAELDDDVPF